MMLRVKILELSLSTTTQHKIILAYKQNMLPI